MSLQLEELISQYAFVLPSVSAFVDSVKRVRVDHNEVLVKYDVREFFMSGTSTQLIWAISRLVPAGRRYRLVLDALQWLLDNQ